MRVKCLQINIGEKIELLEKTEKLKRYGDWNLLKLATN